MTKQATRAAHSGAVAGLVPHLHGGLLLPQLKLIKLEAHLVLHGGWRAVGLEWL